MKHYLIPILLATLVWSCHEDDPGSEEDQKAERTVLVYMAAENDLNTYANADLKEMFTGSDKLNDKQNLVVYVDKAGTAPPFLARIRKGEYTDSLSLDETLSSDPAVLENVLTLTKTRFPAHSYGLVLWGHASGMLISSDSIAYARTKAFGGDTGNGSSSASAPKTWMNIPPLARAIRYAMGDEKLKFVFGDCCNLGAVEVAYELRHVADYLIGSPAEIPDNGAPYELIVPDMFINTENVGQQIIDDYYQYYINVYNTSPLYYNYREGDLVGYSVPLSVVKASALENLASATSQLLGTIGDKLTPGGMLDLANVTYGGIYGSNKYAYDMYEVLKRNTSEADFSAWATAYDEAVPYRKFSKQWFTGFSLLKSSMQSFRATEADCGSLSMFIPQLMYRNTNPNWNESIKLYQWNDAIRWEQYGW